MSTSLGRQSGGPLIEWLEALEKDFDKTFVDLDVLLGDIDSEQADLTFESRRKMAALSGVFAQLIHKTQTVFECNTRQEVKFNVFWQIANVLTMLITVFQVHNLQCQVYAKTVPHESDMIKRKLEREISQFRSEVRVPAKLRAEVLLLRRENERYKRMLLSMQKEIFGARLSAKYLDKELAGRIQQIQLLGRNMKGAEHDRLWNQLEAEIHLHRHKTVIRACRGRGNTKNLSFPPISDYYDLRKKRGIGETRTVKLHKESYEGLGISITGGREHGVPIIISEIHKGQPAERCHKLYIGDAILSVNGIDLRNAKHSDAVEILSSQENDLVMEVVFVMPEQDSDDEGAVVIEAFDGST
uniref:Golgi-associated PDZ and coiled-coil motif-containing protein n=1 Tax=Syphacia muris TaxID=451379 RepID=A0A0N5ARF1_9BILA